MRYLTLLAALLLLVSPQLASQNQSSAQEELAKALESQRHGLTDQAVLHLRFAEQSAEKLDKRTAAEIDLRLAEVYRDLGNMEEFQRMLTKARDIAVGTELEQTLAANYDLGFARALILSEETAVRFLNYLSAADKKLSKIDSETERLSLLSQSINIRVDRYAQTIVALRVLSAAQRTSIPANALSPSMQIFLISALRNESPEALTPEPESRQTDLAPELLLWLDQQRPWDEALLQTALKLNEQVIEIDRQRAELMKKSNTYKPDEVVMFADLERAKDLDQRSDLYQLSANTEQVLAIKQEQLAIFDRHDIFIDAIIVLARIRDIHWANYSNRHERNSLGDALEASSNLIFRVERQTLGLVGQTLDSFLPQFREDYNLHFQMVLEAYRILKKAGDPNVETVLERLLIHADRMNFRPTRRDIAVYQEIGEKIGSNPVISAEFERLKRVVVQKRRAQEQAVSLGKEMSDFPADQPDSNPFLALADAKRQLVTTLEDFKREYVGTSDTRIQLPATIKEVCDGMTDSDGIVLYMRNPETGQFMAAVLQANRTPRLVELPSIKDEQLRSLTSQMYEQFARLDTTPGILKQLGDIFWQPLGSLPENLTIVLSPDLIEIPFESLVTEDGRPVIATHNLRYAFGLAPGLCRVIKLNLNRKAMIAGAERFLERDLDSLDARQEVMLIRNQLKKRGISVAPRDEEALPDDGKTLFAQQNEFDIIHISTHGLLNLSVPMADALAFPTNDVFAFDLALSPVRSKLSVFSACALFENRKNSSNPVSGITTAAMARISPQVISTLWRVDATATQVFMLRFYDALLATAEPSAALAVTKRDFLNTPQLEKWLKSKDLAVPSNIESFKAQHYWASFVLTIGTMKPFN
jgi:CHAT domain-containing protein